MFKDVSDAIDLVRTNKRRVLIKPRSRTQKNNHNQNPETIRNYRIFVSKIKGALTWTQRMWYIYAYVEAFDFVHVLGDCVC